MYKHIIRHHYRIVLKDGIEVRVSKSDFDFVTHKRGETEFMYRTIVRTRRNGNTDFTEYVHIIDEK